jgi:hypothetical protein
MDAQIGAVVLATSGVQLAVGFFGTFISLRVPLENLPQRCPRRYGANGESCHRIANSVMNSRRRI